MKKLNVGNKIKTSGTGGFSFKGGTVKYFEEHIIKSIPFFFRVSQTNIKTKYFFYF